MDYQTQKDRYKYALLFEVVPHQLIAKAAGQDANDVVNFNAMIDALQEVAELLKEYSCR